MITALWFAGVAAAALVVDYKNESTGVKTTNFDCFVVLVAWPYMLVKELMKWPSS